MTNYQTLIKVSLLATVALFFSIVTIDNIIDYQTNWIFVQHVLSMDTTFKSPELMWRSITDPTIQTIFYWFIILWEFVTAVICWIGTYKLFMNEKKHAVLGLCFGILLYLLAFIVIGGEWFAMWQSKDFSGQATAGLFATLFLLILIFINQAE